MISIITPVYNGQRFIEFCIKNVIEQNCRDSEHILIDGGSTDGTVEIIKSYAEKYAHIRWVSEKDMGQSDAMNKGIAMARGEILGFLNADDYYEPNILNHIMELFKTLREPALLVGNCNVWNDDGKISEVNRPARLKITDLMMGWDINPYPTNPSQYFYHKSLHNRIGFFDVNEHYTLDIDFLSRAVQAAHIKYVNEILGNYRKIAGTKTVCDLNNGKCTDRFMAMLEKYREQLSLLQRLEVRLRRWFNRRFFRILNMKKFLFV